MKNNKVKVIPIDETTFAIYEMDCIMYLLVGEDKAMVIDTGMGTIDALQEVRKLTNKPIIVVNTHGHLDHIANNHQFDEIYLNAKDKEVFAAHTNPVFVKEMLKSIYPAPLLLIIRKKFENLLNPKTGGTYHYFGDGHIFDLGGRIVEVVETPGHTPGSVCIVEEKRGYLFSGDTVCDWGILLNLDYCLAPKVYLASIEKLESRQSGFSKIFTGHRTQPIGNEYLNRYRQCAQGIIDGTLPVKKQQQSGKSSLISSFEDVQISYKAEY